MRTNGTYHVSDYPMGDSICITFFEADATAVRKGWRSIGCQSVPVAKMQVNIEIIERNGYTRETRSLAEMAMVIRSAA